MYDTYMKDDEFINKVFETIYGGENRDDQKCEETGKDTDRSLDMALTMIKSNHETSNVLIDISEDDDNFMWWNREEVEKKISYYIKLDKVFLGLKYRLDSAIEDLELVKTDLENISYVNTEENINGQAKV